MKRKIVLVVVAMLLLYMTLGIKTQKVEAEHTTLVFVDPEVSYAALGQTFSVDVSIANVANLSGFEYKFKWNSTLLQCTSYEKCDPPVDLGWSIYWTLIDDLTEGRHFFAVDGAWRENRPFTGNVMLATYTFRVIEVGECPLDLYDVTLVNIVNDPGEAIEDWNCKDSLDDGYFKFRTYEHDIAVFLDSPTKIVPGGSTLLRGTTFNDGLNNETNVELQLHINGSIVNSTVISLLQVHSSKTIDYLWNIPTIEAVYNVTAYALPVPDEELIENNIESAKVLVSYVIKVPHDYKTIQKAVDHANPGETILVSGGTYYEHVIIDKSLTLVGEETNIPIVDGNKTDRCMIVTADNININGFIIQNGFCGINVLHGNFATIIGNKMLNNDAGIALCGSHSSTIIGNTLLDNEIGIAIVDSYNNTFYHNNFINSTYLQFGGETGRNNVEGNYWSDYDGIDTDGDSIGDTPYVIDQNNRDEHPFIIPLDAVPIIWCGTIYPVKLWSNSTVLEIDFNPSQKSISFNVTGLDGTIGFCNITIPSSLFQDLWRGNCIVLVDGKQPLTIINRTDGTYTYIYFTYQQSEREVTIIPEFPSFLIPPLFMVITTLVSIVGRRKHSM